MACDFAEMKSEHRLFGSLASPSILRHFAEIHTERSEHRFLTGISTASSSIIDIPDFCDEEHRGCRTFNCIQSINKIRKMNAIIYADSCIPSKDQTLSSLLVPPDVIALAQC